MTNSDSRGGLLHIVHVKIPSSQRTSSKKHWMLLLPSGWHLTQHPSWPGKSMNHALFRCHLSSGTLPAGTHLSHLFHSSVTRSYRLYPAMPALKDRVSQEGNRLALLSLLSPIHFILAATCPSPQAQLFCGGEARANARQGEQN